MDLHYISATEALKRFKDKSLSPVELIKSIIDQHTHTCTVFLSLIKKKRINNYAEIL